METSKPQPTPMVASTKLTLSGIDLFEEPSLYRSTVGGLQYVYITRPELAYSVNKVSPFMHNPLIENWNAVKRILRYLQGTKEMGLQLQKCSFPRLTALSDADWALSPIDRCSTSAFCIYFGPNLVSWMSKK